VLSDWTIVARDARSRVGTSEEVVDEEGERDSRSREPRWGLREGVGEDSLGEGVLDSDCW
jgi:hypothetical protein